MARSLPLVGLCIAMLAGPGLAQTLPAALPEQPHVTLADGGLVVHFALSGLPYTASEAPRVTYSIDGGASAQAEATVVGTVAAVDPTDGFATTVYAATIPVEPGQTLTYSAGDAVRGEVGPFTVRRPDTQTLRLVVMGDIGYDGVGPDGAALTGEAPPIAMRDLALEQEPDLFVIPGDLSYANGRAGWDRFMRMHAPLQATVPTMPSIGNHEWHDGIGYAQFLAEYVLPGNEMDYVFHAGPVTFIAVNSDAICLDRNGRSGSTLLAPCPNGLDQDRTAWLEQALAEAQADERPWTVVYMHHPPYSWGRHGNDWASQIYWSPLFETYGVDLVVTAHDHLYSRSHPIVQRQATATGNEYRQGDGPIYVVLGGGGRELYQASPDTPPAWYAAGESVHHLGLFDIDGQGITYRALRVDGSTLDEFTIQSGAPADARAGPAPSVGLLMVLVAALAFVRLHKRRGEML